MDFSEIREAVVRGDMEGVTRGVRQGLEAGAASGDLLSEALIPGMIEVGDLFESGDVFVPEMLLSARAMKAGLEVLKPMLVTDGIQPLGTVALGTVQGDIHDVGKNLVAMMLEGAGFKVIDLGVNVPPERFVQAARDGAQILGLSALLTTTVRAMPTVIQALEAAGLREKVHVMVGGAPVTDEFAEETGADGFAADASLAVKRAKMLLGII